jgi:PKD repeat protein
MRMRTGCLIAVSAVALVMFAMPGCGRKSSDAPLVPDAPVANFTASPLSGGATLGVQFTSLCTGSITGYLWDFGDGGTSTEASPLHDYLSNGLYDVTLSATGAWGSDTETKTGYIYVGPGIPGLRPETDLTHNLCNWPADEFSPANHVSVQIAIAVGDYAIDFTLKDPRGVDYNLGVLLQTKPVLLIFGSCT